MRQSLRDWWRGFTDADLAEADRLLAAPPTDVFPGQWVEMSGGVFKAYCWRIRLKHAR